MPINYEKTKIYKLVCEDSPAVYISATTKALCQRLAQHKESFKRYNKGLGKWCPSFEILAGKNPTLELIESFQCETKDEQNKRLNEIIKNTKEAINNKEKPQDQAPQVQEVENVEH